MSLKRSRLNTGEQLRANDYLVSENQLFFAIMQSDGNFCVYAGSSPAANYGLNWAAMAPTGSGDYYATVQADGNFCIYKDGKHSWAIGRSLPVGDYFLIIQNDGNLCLYRSKQQDGKTVHEGIWNAGKPAYIQKFHIDMLSYDLENGKTTGTKKVEIYRNDQQNFVGLLEDQKNGGLRIEFATEWQDGRLTTNHKPDADELLIPFYIGVKLENVSPEETISREVLGLRPFANKDIGPSSVFVNYRFQPGRSYSSDVRGVSISANLMYYEVPYTITGKYVLDISPSKYDKKEAEVPFSYNGVLKGCMLWDNAELTINKNAQKSETVVIPLSFLFLV